MVLMTRWSRRRWLGKAGLRSFRCDERGGTAVQAIVFLPVILLSMVVLMTVLQTISIRSSLHTGTYLAARYLSLYPVEYVDPAQWSPVAEKFVFQELRNNPWVDPLTLGPPDATVNVYLPNGNDCGATFWVEAVYPIRPFVNDKDSRFLPGQDLFVLTDKREGKVLCKR